MTCHRREKTQRLLDRAARLMTLGDAPAAAALTRQSVRLEPSHDRARLLHAQALLATGKPLEAVRALNAAAWYDQAADKLSIDPADLSERLVVRAAAQHQLGEPHKAARALHDAVDLSPRHNTAIRRLAALLIEQGRADDAIEYLLCIHNDASPDPALLRMLAEAYESAERIDDALRCYEQLAADEANDPTLDPAALQLRIARLMRRVDRIADARVYYDALIARHDDDIELRLEAANLAIEHGDDVRARHLLEQTLRIDADHPAARTALAEQHMRCGRFEPAARCWHRLARAHRDRPDAVAGLIVCAINCCRHSLAERLLADFRHRFTAAQQHAALTRAWRLSIPGQLLNRPTVSDRSAPLDVLAGVTADAARTLGQVIEEHPDHADLHYHLAVCCTQLGQHERAAASLDRALALNGGYLAAARRRIDDLMTRRQRDAAVALLAAVLEHKPDTRELADLQAAVDVIADRVDLAVERLRGAGLDRVHLQSAAESVTDALYRYGADPNRIHRWRRVVLTGLDVNLAIPYAAAA